jgi:4-hydroxy-4-methyl-2-oxoglutarate aldolase
MTDLIERLRAVQVSSLCDADKAMPVLASEVHAMLPGLPMVGPAVTVVCHDDHLPMFAALRAAEPGSVLVVACDGHRRAVSGELFATEAERRGLAGIVVDGYVRDMRGLRTIGLPVYARGTCPASGTTRDPGTVGTDVVVGGVPVRPGDLVAADDDGVIAAPAERLEAALPGAEEIERAERALLDAMASGRELHGLTTVDEHVAALAAGQDSTLGFLV